MASDFAVPAGIARAASKASSALASRSRSLLGGCAAIGLSPGVFSVRPSAIEYGKREKVANVPNPRNFPVRPYVLDRTLVSVALA
jgi:hypothetical protein